MLYVYRIWRKDYSNFGGQYTNLMVQVIRNVSRSVYIKNNYIFSTGYKNYITDMVRLSIIITNTAAHFQECLK